VFRAAGPPAPADPERGAPADPAFGRPRHPRGAPTVRGATPAPVLMLSRETCRQLARRKFIRQPFRTVLGMALCFGASLVALGQGQADAAVLFGAIGGVFLAVYGFATLVVWRAGGLPPD